MTLGRKGEGSKYEKMLQQRSFDVKSVAENKASIISKYFLFQEAFMSFYPFSGLSLLVKMMIK